MQQDIAIPIIMWEDFWLFGVVALKLVSVFWSGLLELIIHIQSHRSDYDINAKLQMGS